MTNVEKLQHMITVLRKVQKDKKKFKLSEWGYIEFPEEYRKNLIPALSNSYIENNAEYLAKGFSTEHIRQRNQYIRDGITKEVKGLSLFKKNTTKLSQLECGCAIGHAGYDDKFKKEGLKLYMEVDIHYVFADTDLGDNFKINVYPIFKGETGVPAMASFFSINSSVAFYLFSPGVERNIGQEIKAIEKVIKVITAHKKKEPKPKEYYSLRNEGIHVY